MYRIAGKFGGGNLANLANRPWFAKLKPSNLVLTIEYLLADLLIRHTFFREMLKKSQFAKVSPRQTFTLYGIPLCSIAIHTNLRWSINNNDNTWMCWDLSAFDLCILTFALAYNMREQSLLTVHLKRQYIMCFTCRYRYN